MTTNILKLAGIAVAGIVVGLLASASGVVNLGGIYNQTSNYFSQGIYAGLTNQFSVDTDGDVTTSGDVVITTAANATSSLTVGCINATATSSATPVKLVFNTQATTSLQGAAAGAVVWQY